MKKEDLISKTIEDVTLKKYEGYDDAPILEIKFTDGSFVYIESTYGMYTGHSIDEYPSYIHISDSVDYADENLIDK